MTKFSTLIERLEKATGPDRELDRGIGEAIDAKMADSGDVIGLGYARFTESIDAALALVPEGEKYRPHKVILAVSQSGDRFAAIIDNWHWGKLTGHGRNYAIALSIAALRAREEG